MKKAKKKTVKKMKAPKKALTKKKAGRQSREDVDKATAPLVGHMKVKDLPVNRIAAIGAFRTLIVAGLTRGLNDELKADGFTYSWAERCWHIEGTDSKLRGLFKKYSKEARCEIRKEPVKSEGKNPMQLAGKSKAKTHKRLNKAFVKKQDKARIAAGKNFEGTALYATIVKAVKEALSA